MKFLGQGFQKLEYE